MTYEGEDTVEMNVPLLIRLLEWAREDAPTDMDLHVAAENLVRLSDPRGGHLTMDDYGDVVG